MRHILFLVLLLILTSLSSPAFASRTYLVSTTGSGTNCSYFEPCSFQQALDLASADGEDSYIYLFGGTYKITDTFTYGAYDGDGSLFIMPFFFADVTFDTDYNNKRTLFINNDKDYDNIGDGGGTIEIRDITFNGHYSFAEGGGIEVTAKEADIIIENCKFNYNTETKDYNGGALNVYSSSGTITIKGNEFIGNRSSQFGGGVSAFARHGRLIISENTFQDNYAGIRGGGISALTDDGYIEISGNQFTDNDTDNTGSGGALSVFTYTGTVMVTNNYFFENNMFETTRFGGAIDLFLQGGTVDITGNRIFVNIATYEGGGIYGRIEGGVLNITNNMIGENRVTDGAGSGGGILIELLYGTANIINNTIYGNEGSLSGGISVRQTEDNAVLNIHNNIIYNNNANALGEDLKIYSDNNDNGIGSAVNIYNNDFSGNAVFDEPNDSSPGDGTLQSEDLYISDIDNYSYGSNIQVDPLLIFPSNLNYGLQPGSPCIDQGNNNAPALPQTDFEGDQRIVNIVDIGADEYNTVTLTSPNGGETIPSGGSHTITWSARQGAVSFDLEYSINDGGTWRTIATGVTGTSYDWSVPAVAGNKRKCRVRITAYDSSSNMVGQDISDSRFMIEVIKVTAPNGGETWSRGTTNTITWTTNATKTPITKVVIKYHEVGVTGWNLIDVIKGGNPGTYNWTIPTTLNPGDYKIKVNLWDANKRRRGADKSDGPFTIN